MLMTGDLKIHKTDAAVRHCEAVVRLEDGGLAVYDTLPANGWEYRGNMLWTEMGDPIEPHIIAQPDEYERVEVDGHHWKDTSPQALRDRAERRDDVDADELPDNL